MDTPASAPTPTPPPTAPIAPPPPPVPTSSQPTAPVAPVQPPLSPAAPSVRQGDPLADLSPMSVLAKRSSGGGDFTTPPAPPVPAPVAPQVQAQSGEAPLTSSDLDRDTLLKQAAVAPANSFILPQGGSPSAPPPPPPPAQASSSGVNATAPLSSRPVPPPVGNTQMVPPGGMKTPPQLSVNPVAPILPVTQKKTHPLLIGAGLFLLVLIGVGTLYVLASSGTRVPFLYRQVSGLPGGGIAASQTGLTYVQSHAKLQQIGDISLKATSVVKPTLPSSGLGSAVAAAVPVSSMHTSVTSPDALVYSRATDSWLGKISLNVDAAASVPAYFTAPSSSKATDVWLFKLPANTETPLVTIAQSDVQHMVLYTMLRPVSLATLLPALQSEKSYDTQQLNGRKLAHYRYVVNGAQLTDLLPTGAKWQSLEAELSYVWNTGEVGSSLLDGTFTYLGGTYHVQESWNYSNWDKPLNDPNNTDLSQLSDSTVIPTAKAVSQSDFVAEFGIASFNSIPHDTAAGSGSAQPVATPAPTPTASPTATASPSISPTASPSASAVVTISPSASPSPSQAAISPTGQSITTALDPITVPPPLPVTPASVDSQSRDVQRLKDLTDLQTALNRYKAVVGSYPKTAGLEQTRSSVTLLNALVPSYMSAIPVDPLSDSNWYEYQSDGTTFTLRAIAEDSSNAKAKQGVAYSYFEITSTN